VKKLTLPSFSDNSISKKKRISLVILFTVFDVFTTRMTATAIYSRVIEINKFNPGGILTTYFFYWSIVTELCAVHISAEKSALFFYSFIISQYMSADCWPTFLCRQQIRPINQPKMFADFSGLLSVPFCRSRNRPGVNNALKDLR